MIFFKNLLFFLILFDFNNILVRTSYIILPFKTSTKEKKEYPENILQNDIEVTLNIGKPPQSVDLNLRSKAYTMFVTSINTKLPYAKFNESNSNSLIKKTEKPEPYGRQEYSKGYMVYDSVHINGKEIKNVSFILAIEVDYKESGALGLRLVDTHESGNDLSFIYQMKNLYQFDSYTYMIKYKNNDEGELIIGAYPHMYDNNYNEKNLIYSKAGVIKNNVDWILTFDIVKYDNKTINLINRLGFTQIEFGLIQAPFGLKKYLNEHFFKGKCTEKFNQKRNITIFHCDENFDITSFKNLTFILKDINLEFTLTYEDIFIKNNNEYIFGIVFNEDEDNKDATWILGKPFMKKYELIYDLDRKIISTYNGKSYEKEQKKNENSSLALIIILIILGVVVIGLIVFIIYYIKKPKRNRAFELNDDNYEYFPNE